MQPILMCELGGVTGGCTLDWIQIRSLPAYAPPTHEEREGLIVIHFEGKFHVRVFLNFEKSEN